MGLIVLAVLLVIAVAAFLRTSPQGVERRRLLACNAATLALSVPAAIAAGVGQKGMAMHLAVMSAGATALLVIAVGGLFRNFVLFPRSRRSP